MCCTWKFWLWNTDTWTAITAVGTVLLALFALTAWLTSKESLKIANREAGEAKKLAVESLDAQARSEQIAAMSAYVRALFELGEIHKRSPAKYHVPTGGDNYIVSMSTDIGYASYVSDLCRNVELTGALWRIHHPEIDDALSEFAAYEYSVIESVRIWVKHRNGEFSDDLHELNFLYSKILASNARDWQAMPKQRSHIESLLRPQRHYLEQEVEEISGHRLK